MAAKSIFISYGREQEIVPFVHKLKADIEAAGFECWLDSDDIPAGSDWHGAIGTGLDSCKAILCVISSKYIQSRYCTSELYAANADGKLIFPLIYEDVNFSANERSRGVKYIIAGYNWTMFRPGKDDYISSMKRLIRGLTEKKLKPDVVQTPNDSMSKLSLNDSQSDNPPSYEDSQVAMAMVQPQHQKATRFFEVGMRLEAVDRKFPWFVCVAHVEDSRPNERKIKIHFDGWTCRYDYWSDADTLDLHPVGWCERNGWEIQKPGSASGGKGFMWEEYLRTNHFQAATDDCFVQCQLDGTGSHHFKNGMYLEVEMAGRVHVAKITLVEAPANGSIHVQLETDRSKAVFKKNSCDIHPAMWASKNHRQLTNPFAGFRWSEFLGGQEKIPAPAFLFSEDQRSLPAGAKLPGAPNLPPPVAQVGLQHIQPYDYDSGPYTTDDDDDDDDDDDGVGLFGEFHFGGQNRFPGGNLPPPLPRIGQAQELETVKGFHVNRKLEARDLKHPGLVCVATIADIRMGKLLIHFDGWTQHYDFWCEPDFKEIHPVGWCAQVGHVLQKPHQYNKAFSWEQYLEEMGAEQVPVNSFTPEQRGGV